MRTHRAGAQAAKIGRGIGFADCLVRADSQIIARGNETYRFYEEASAASEERPEGMRLREVK